MADARSVNELIDDVVSPGYEQIKAAQKELISRGASVIPALLEALPRCAEDMWLGQVLAGLGEPALRALLQVAEQDGFRRNAALRALWEFESQAALIVPELLRFFSDADPGTRRAAVHAIARIGPGAVIAADAIADACGDPDSEVRWSALYAVKTVQLPASKAVPLLLGALSDSEVRVRINALQVLREQVAHIKELPRALLSSATHENPQVRRAALELVAELGPLGKDALPEIAQSLELPNLDLIAAEAIWKTSKRSDLVVPVILRNVERLPEETCDLITLVGPAAIDALPALLTVLKSSDYDTLWAAANAVEALGPAAKKAVPILIHLLSHESGLVAGGAAGALGAIGKPAVKPLIQVLKKGTPHAREFAADALGRLGDIATPALPHLVSLLKKEGLVEDPIWVFIAVAEITPQQDFIEELVPFMEAHPNSFARYRLAGALGKLGFDGLAAVPGLERATADPDPKVRQAATEAIRRITGKNT